MILLVHYIVYKTGIIVLSYNSLSFISPAVAEIHFKENCSIFFVGSQAQGLSLKVPYICTYFDCIVELNIP